MKTLSSFTTRQPIQILKKKCDLCFVCHWSPLITLAPAEQSIHLLIGAEQQLLLYHTINLKLGHCYLKTINLNLGRRCGQKNWNCLSLVTSHVVGTSRAEHTTSYRGRATTSFISYHQLKTWSLLSKDNQSKSWGGEDMGKLKLFVIGHFSCSWN